MASKRKYVGNGVWVDIDEETPKSSPLDAALEDVAARFLTHLPPSELESADRLFFQLEQAHWFYEDFLADAPGSKLPHFHLRLFTQHLFARCALLKPLVGAYEQLFSNFREYKGKIPVCGCVLLDPSLTKVVLVRNWQKTSWGLPKGKLNQHESKLACAAREVAEETGYDCRDALNDDDDYIEIINDKQHATMFVVPGVPLDYPFEPKVRKEISKIAFFPLDSLPNEQWNVEKFIPRIKRWIKLNRKKANKKSAQSAPAKLEALPPKPPPPTTEQTERSSDVNATKKKKKQQQQKVRFQGDNDDDDDAGVVVIEKKPRPPLYVPPPVDYGGVSFGPDFVMDVDAILAAVDAVLLQSQSQSPSQSPSPSPAGGGWDQQVRGGGQQPMTRAATSR